MVRRIFEDTHVVNALLSYEPDITAAELTASMCAAVVIIRSEEDQSPFGHAHQRPL
jgi:hypothetical protein